MWGLSLVVASGGHSSSRCAGLSPSRPLLLRSTGSRCAGSVVVAHGPSCSVARGIFPDQGSNPCPLHQQADSQPLRHQGSPLNMTFKVKTLNITYKVLHDLAFVYLSGLTFVPCSTTESCETADLWMCYSSPPLHPALAFPDHISCCFLSHFN